MRPLGGLSGSDRDSVRDSPCHDTPVARRVEGAGAVAWNRDLRHNATLERALGLGLVEAPRAAGSE